MHSHLYRLYNSAKALGFNYTAIESALKHLDINTPHTHKDLNILESLEILAKSSLPNRDIQYHIMRLEFFSYYTQYNKTNMLDFTLYNDNANATLYLWNFIHTLQKLLQIGNNDFIANDFSFLSPTLNKRRKSVHIAFKHYNP